MYYFPLIGSGRKEDAAADGHNYHAYTYTYDYIHLCFVLFSHLYRFWMKGKCYTADGHSHHVYTCMIAFTCFFKNQMYYFPTYIAIGSGRKEDAAANGHSYHAYTYIRLQSPVFLTVTLLSYTYELLYFQ